MGTREVYEQKLRSGNLHHDPTMNPGLGTPRCPRCLSLLAHDSDKGEWTITHVLHDATAVRRKVWRSKPVAGTCSRCGCGASVADIKTSTRFCYIPVYWKSWKAIMCTFCGAILKYYR